MLKATRPRINELVEEGLSQGNGPFENRIFAVSEVTAWLNDQARDRNIVTAHRVCAQLKKSGAQHFGRLSLGKQADGCKLPTLLNKEEQVFAGPDLKGASDLTNAEVCGCFGWVVPRTGKM